MILHWEGSAPAACAAGLPLFKVPFMSQVEGGWSAGGKGLSNWDVWTEDTAHTADGSSGRVAADSYHHWRQDVALAAAMGVGVYRFSVAWARVLPEGLGRVSPEVATACVHVCPPIVMNFYFICPRRDAGNPILNIFNEAALAIFSACKRLTGTCLQS